jgi:hypothetical protein
LKKRLARFLGADGSHGDSAGAALGDLFFNSIDWLLFFQRVWRRTQFIREID